MISLFRGHFTTKNSAKSIYKNNVSREYKIDTNLNTPCLFTSSVSIQF